MLIHRLVCIHPKEINVRQVNIFHFGVISLYKLNYIYFGCFTHRRHLTRRHQISLDGLPPLPQPAETLSHDIIFFWINIYFPSFILKRYHFSSLVYIHCLATAAISFFLVCLNSGLFFSRNWDYERLGTYAHNMANGNESKIWKSRSSNKVLHDVPRLLPPLFLPAHSRSSQLLFSSLR